MFSVIIPYYKKRKFIERCLDVVLNNRLNDLEISLISYGVQAKVIKEKISWK